MTEVLGLVHYLMQNVKYLKTTDQTIKKSYTSQDGHMHIKS